MNHDTVTVLPLYDLAARQPESARVEYSPARRLKVCQQCNDLSAGAENAPHEVKPSGIGTASGGNFTAFVFPLCFAYLCIPLKGGMHEESLAMKRLAR